MKEYLFQAIIAWILAALLDILLGDPHWLWHPVQGMGRLIQLLERKLYPPEEGLSEALREEPEKEEELEPIDREEPAAREDLRKGARRSCRMRGGILVLLVLLVTGVFWGGLVALAYRIHPGLGVALWSLMGWQSIAGHSLGRESMRVYYDLKRNDIPAARRDLSMIVGRDTAGLNAAGISRAAVETVAENSSDGVIAPLCCLLLGGPVLAFLYKAINTMDSMIGYQNDRYRYFGTAAARLDDLVNFPFARLSALAIILAAGIRGGREDGTRALRIFRRDRYRHKSPNAGQTEAAMAGALGLELGGDASYFGRPVRKPTMGDPLREIEAEDIPRACRLMYMAAGLVWTLGLGILLLVFAWV